MPSGAGSSRTRPGIAAIKETFRYVAEAGDKAVGFFYGQLFLRQPYFASCSRQPWMNSGTGCSVPSAGSWRACPRRMRWLPTSPSWVGTIEIPG